MPLPRLTPAGVSCAAGLSAPDETEDHPGEQSKNLSQACRQTRRISSFLAKDGALIALAERHARDAGLMLQAAFFILTSL
jgi:hypothetical protein